MTIYIGSGQTTMIVAQTAGEMLLIETGVTVEVPDLACDASGDAVYRSFLIRGTLASTTGTAFLFGTSPTYDSHAWMKIDDDAIIRSGGKGLVINGAGFSLENVGKVLTGGTGVTISGTACVVTNNDTMSSWGGRLFEITGRGAIITNNVTMDARIDVVSGSGDGLILTNNKTMSAMSGAVLSWSGNKAIVTNNGTMSATGHVLSIAGNDAVITNTATIKSSAGFGIVVSGDDAALTNHDTITGMAGGLSVTGAGFEATNYATISGFQLGVELAGSDAVFVNHATIQGGVGLRVSGSGNQIENNGTIAANLQSQAAVLLDGTGSRLVNNGAITAVGGIAVNGGDGDVTLVNRGTITGSVDLGGGDDFFDTMGGKLTGSASGGAGDDTYVLDRAIKIVEAVDGGTDTMMATYSARLLANIEILRLIGKGETSGTGNGLDNWIYGNRQANVLNGGSGDDHLIGGKGNDRLLGGEGADTFHLEPGSRADSVGDFDIDADFVLLDGFAGINGFSDVEKLMHQDGADVLIDLGRAASLRLEGVSIEDLSADNFLF